MTYSEVDAIGSSIRSLAHIIHAELVGYSDEYMSYEAVRVKQTEYVTLGPERGRMTKSSVIGADILIRKVISLIHVNYFSPNIVHAWSKV